MKSLFNIHIILSVFVFEILSCWKNFDPTTLHSFCSSFNVSVCWTCVTQTERWDVSVCEQVLPSANLFYEQEKERNLIISAIKAIIKKNIYIYLTQKCLSWKPSWLNLHHPIKRVIRHSQSTQTLTLMHSKICTFTEPTAEITWTGLFKTIQMYMLFYLPETEEKKSECSNIRNLKSHPSLCRFQTKTNSPKFILYSKPYNNKTEKMPLNTFVGLVSLPCLPPMGSHAFLIWVTHKSMPSHDTNCSNCKVADFFVDIFYDD